MNPSDLCCSLSIILPSDWHLLCASHLFGGGLSNITTSESYWFKTSNSHSLSSNEQSIKFTELTLLAFKFQFEVEKEKLALELQEEKKAQVEREQRIKEQEQKIVNLSTLVISSAADGRDEQARKVYLHALFILIISLPQVLFQEAVAGLFHDDCNGLMAWPENFHIFLFSTISPGPLSSQPKSGDGYWPLCKISILGAFLRNFSSPALFVIISINLQD